MSVVEARPAPSARYPDAGPARPRRRLRVVAIAVVLLLLVAAGALAVKVAFDAAALQQVRTFLDARPLTCADPSDVTTVSGGAGSEDDSYRVPAVKGALRLDCVLSVVIRNGSDRDIQVQAVALPFFGPESRMGLRSDHALTQQSDPASANDGRDVVYTWGSHPLTTLGAGDSFTYRIHLTSDGCRQAGSTWVTDAPIVTVATGLASREAPLDGAGFGLLGVRTTAQPCR